MKVQIAGTLTSQFIIDLDVPEDITADSFEELFNKTIEEEYGSSDDCEWEFISKPPASMKWKI